MVLGQRRPALLAGLIFFVLTVLMTYPLSFFPGSRVRDYGDSLLNTWILATVGHKLFHLDFKNFFSANIFFPDSQPLLYSEILIPQAIVAWPLLKASGNPALAHNFALLLAIFTSAWGMFFLAYHLTRNFWASIIAGIIFGFSPFMMAHTVQLQVVSAGGLPLIFLFLHRYFDRWRVGDWLGFILIYLIQSLANIYYALFLLIFTGLFILFACLMTRAYLNRKFWVHMAGFLILGVLCLGPLFRQYALQQQKKGFERSVGAQAKISSYLATGKFNRLYGRWSARFREPEGELFPGFSTVLLALTGISLLFRKKTPANPSVFPSGEENRLMTSDHIPSFLSHNAHKRCFRDNSFFPFSQKIIFLYVLVMLIAISLSFGMKGPFWVFHRFIPGFKAIRAVPRFHIFAMLSLALLAAWGVSLISAKTGSLFWRRMLLVGFGGVLLLEFLSVPLPTRPIPSREKMPAVYQELASWPEKKVILELPLPAPGSGIGQVESLRMYYSLFHGHRLVNGYSGFFSPVYIDLRERLNRDSLAENILHWKKLGVELVVIHGDELGTGEFSSLIEAFKASPYLHFRGQLAHDFLFSLI